MRWKFILYWAVFSGLSIPQTVSGQDIPYDLPEYPFVNYSENHLSFPGDSNAMDLLWDKLDLLLTKGEGQIRMMQIGGSHIQADIWSDRMRRRMQTFFPGNKGFRGFIFPAKMANTNNPWNFIPSWTGNWESLRNVQYQKTGSLGLSGMSVTTRDSNSMLTVEFRGGDYLTYELDRVKVFHETGKENFKIQLVDSQLVHRMFTDTILGYTEIQFRDLQERFSIRFVKTDSLQKQFTLYGLSLENREPGITYDAIGVNGASVPSYLRCNLFEQHISVIKPDVVILSIGINDANTLNFNSARYEANYDELVSRIRRANPDAIIIFTTNNDSYYKRKYPNKNALEVQKTMLRLGKKHNAVVWDMFTIMGGLGSIRLWQGSELAANDRIHLTAKGYTFLADLMFNALLQEYDRKLAAAGKKGQH